MRQRSGFFHTAFAAIAAVFCLLGASANTASARGAGPIGDRTSAAAPESPRFSSATINGAEGGTLVLNGWKLLIPAGAYTGSATITMTEIVRAEPTVDLQISDPSKNAFRVPVALSYKYRNGNEASDKVISWWDPVNLMWVDVSGRTVDVQQGWVTVPLWHFSTYRTSKAGW